MFKYVNFTRVETDKTVLKFRGGDEDVKVFHFDGDVVSISSEDETKIDELIASQDEQINCTELTKDEFKAKVSDTRQLNCIRDLVAMNIAKKYTLADEIALGKRVDTDEKKIAYDAYVAECVAKGTASKEVMGY